jgi:pimeloyl-ACP methyl ester carboxylesterase
VKLRDAVYNERVCHELGERRNPLPHDPRAEEIANRLGACFAAPRPAFKRAWQKFGADLEKLAAYFIVTQSLVALRIGEVVGVSCALVTPERVYRRGLVETLPPDAELREFARSGYYPGLRLLPISDVRRRWLVLYAGI